MPAQDWTERPLRLQLSHGGVDPDHLAHDQESLLDELWERPGTLILPLRGSTALTDAEHRLALLPRAEVEREFLTAGTTEPLRLYLGRISPEEGLPDDGILVAGGLDTPSTAVPVIGIMLDDAAPVGHIGRWRGLLDLAPVIDARDIGLLTRAIALANWHRSHAYSPRTGRPTSATKAGWVRVDEEDGTEHFPRTDPAVIVAVTDTTDRLLLASNAAWEEHRFSLIAGFVDPGESLEDAVIREVREESGLRVRHPRYLGSQPWPFPSSLMLGFAAELAGSPLDQAPDGVEIRSLRWFTRAELADESARGLIALPGSASIARSIIEAWYGGVIPAAT